MLFGKLPGYIRLRFSLKLHRLRLSPVRPGFRFPPAAPLAFPQASYGTVSQSRRRPPVSTVPASFPPFSEIRPPDGCPAPQTGPRSRNPSLHGGCCRRTPGSHGRPPESPPPVPSPARNRRWPPPRTCRSVSSYQYAGHIHPEYPAAPVPPAPSDVPQALSEMLLYSCCSPSFRYFPTCC